MKKISWLIFFIVFAAASCIIYVPVDEGQRRSPRGGSYDERDQYDRYEDMDTSYFYDYLGDYGNWVYLSPHGYVWLPRASRYGWRPYTLGRWVWTDYGWTWMSSEPWGWIPYHYGRWGWERRIGWYWVPDIIWAPAWVTWRWGDIYIGWAPLPPGAEFRRGYGFRYRDYDIPYNYWVFIDGRHFQNSYLDRYVLPYERNRTVIHLAQLKADVVTRGDRIVNEGIDIDQIRRATKQDVEKYVFREGRSPEDIKLEGRDVVLYKPDIRKNTDAKPKDVLDEDQALENVERSRIRRLGTDKNADQELETEQIREQKILEESQEEEVNVVRKKADKEIESAKTDEEKQKIENEEKTKVNELKKKHEEEKSELSKRHKEESDRVKEGRIRKKGEDK